MSKICAAPGQLSATHANFLRTTPTADFTHVLMNPPFCGTHWMEHVRHAFEFLAPGGSLHAILPASAEVGTSSKHLKFRAWAQQYTRWGDELRFETLPPGSFSESGTNVQTVILRIYREG